MAMCFLLWWQIMEKKLSDREGLDGELNCDIFYIPWHYIEAYFWISIWGSLEHDYVICIYHR